MALLDYKIVNFSHNGRHVEAFVRVYRGDITTEQEDVGGVLTDVTRYRRIAKVFDRTFNYDVPQEMTRDEFIAKACAYLNKKLLDYASVNRHTVITPQQDIMELEAVTNESTV